MLQDHMFKRGFRGFSSSRSMFRSKLNKSKSNKYVSLTAKLPTKDTNKPLSREDIQLIQANFLKRTNDLEPDIRLKTTAQIHYELDKRFNARYLQPSKSWYESNWEKLNEKRLTLSIRELINKDPAEFKFNYYKNLKFNIEDVTEPLKIGDIVLLKTNTSEFSMCIDLPQSLKDPRYTFISSTGDLIFGMRSMILLKIPFKLPGNIERLIIKEPAHKYNPIGTIKSSLDETVLVPVIARQLLINFMPAQISKCATKQLPVIIKKLELLHRYLQDFSGPQQIHFHKLINIIEALNLDRATDYEKGNEYVNELLKQKYYNDYTDLSLSSLDATVALSTYWAIIEQQDLFLWGEIKRNSSSLFPTTVTILPFSHHVYYTKLIKSLRKNNFRRTNEFSAFINEHNLNTSSPEIQFKFPEFLHLLKEYCAGNLLDNPKIITILSKIFRNLNDFKERDITKDLAYELLTKLIPTSNLLANPLLANHDLSLPTNSGRGENQSKLYELATPTKIESGETTTKRHNFNDLNVYCIDSETAHEIDDGISIKKYLKIDLLYSFILLTLQFISMKDSNKEKKTGIDDDILKIAYYRSFTTYLPDNVVPMLPSKYCEMSDLGKSNQNIETLTFSVDITIFDGSNNEETLKILYDTFKIQFGLVSNFPKVTYDTVDKILDNSTKIPDTSITEDLRQLSRIAKLLRKYRINENNAIVFGEGFNRGIPDLQSTEDEIIFTDQKNSDSNELVSEMMILANTLTGKYCKDHKIPVIYRCYSPLDIGPEAQQECIILRSKNIDRLPSNIDMAKMSSFLNSSYYSGTPSRHSMLGSDEYATVTSPLRRFPDLLNHIQLHNHLKGYQLPFTPNHVAHYLTTIQSRSDTLKNIGNAVYTEMTLNYIKLLINKEPTKAFDVLVTSVPIEGSARCAIVGYEYARGTIKLKAEINPVPIIGDIITKCKVTKIFPIEGALELSMEVQPT
ncbi:exoribonuclease II NDAI_0K00320 [Naumovozyma dairenensis CBS 421]|uniref:RNB domain-containing protein n=1 Tax=Naumovozyma dairenensis (strain ATCC 10597 / BCRC 20456 / CBS 421 / NBRC 0211 / NRRL Y-12639) TaxID=1071378 RepID=G0WHG0_NAUDC|nr:hypothetical protein NDAI_0K00320 [Naumovozyma dairenensis CBS 421]CCD27221.1 hypothetical protein NDAI_0K00320 [Naumovozyma dairenensis CBS 421]